MAPKPKLKPVAQILDLMAARLAEHVESNA